MFVWFEFMAFNNNLLYANGEGKQVGSKMTQ